MRPIPLKNPYLRLDPPRYWDEELSGPCVSLDVIAGEGQRLYSFWRPEPEELAALNRGAPLRLGLASMLHPAVRVGVIDDQDPDYPSLLAGFAEEKGN